MIRCSSLPQCASCENVDLNYIIAKDATEHFMICPLYVCAIETQRTCGAVQATVHKHTYIYGSFRIVLNKMQDDEYIFLYFELRLLSQVEGLYRYIDTVILHDFDRTVGITAASRFTVKVQFFFTAPYVSMTTECYIWAYCIHKHTHTHTLCNRL